jgi:serine/threonine protein kinase
VRKAIKIVKKGNAADLSRLDVEIKAMTVMRHPNIVALEEVLETEEHVFFVMELLQGGSLADHVAIQPFSDDVARHFFRQVLLGVRFCHSKNVRHRDLKLENILLDMDGLTCKVCDFGHAGISSQGWDMFSTGLVGSLFHITPEQLSNQCYSGEKIDIWALGVLLYRMLTGKPPFYTENMHEMAARIMKAEFPVPANMNPLAVDLLRRILKVDPE